MEVVLVRSKITNLDTIIQFIKLFSATSGGSNKYAMILACVESITYLIEKGMDAQHLNMNEA